MYKFKFPFVWQALLSIILFSLLVGLMTKFSSGFALNYFAPIVTIFLLACMYASRHFHREKLGKPSAYLLPVFCVISFSIMLITFLFGLQGGIISAYNKSENANGDKLKWFRMDDVLSFPKEQLQLKKEVPLERIDFTEYKDTLNTCHIVIVDKTASIINSDSSTNAYLRTSIIKRFSLPQLDENTPTCDLIAPFIISGVYNNSLNHADESLCLFIYDGISDDFINVTNGIGYTIQASRLKDSDYFSKYFESMNICKENISNNKSKQKTSINRMLDLLSSKLKDVEDLKRNTSNGNKDFNKYKLSIISDFINTDAQEKASDISRIINIDELKTYTLLGLEKQNKTYTSSMLIADMTKNFRHFKGNENIDFSDSKNLQTFYDKLKFSNFKKYDKIGSRAINFHYPYSSFNSNQSSQIRISVSDLFNKNDNLSSRYFIRIFDVDDPGNKKLYSIKRIGHEDPPEETVCIGELHSLNMYSKDVLLIIFPNANAFANNRLTFEIASEEKSKILLSSISFLPSLSEGCALFLLFCYSVFIFCISLILILPNVFVLVLIGKNKVDYQSFWDAVCLSLPIVIGLYLLVLPFYLYNGIWGLHKVLVLIGLLIFSIPAFVSSFIENNSTERGYFAALPFWGNKPGPTTIGS